MSAVFMLHLWFSSQSDTGLMKQVIVPLCSVYSLKGISSSFNVLQNLVGKPSGFDFSLIEDVEILLQSCCLLGIWLVISSSFICRFNYPCISTFLQGFPDFSIWFFIECYNRLHFSGTQCIVSFFMTDFIGVILKFCPLYLLQKIHHYLFALLQYFRFSGFLILVSC